MTGRGILFCDCCHREQMAFREPDRIVVFKRSHGKKHVLRIPLGGSTTDKKLTTHKTPP